MLEDSDDAASGEVDLHRAGEERGRRGERRALARPLGGALADDMAILAAEFDAAGFPLMEPEQIANAILAAGRSEETGQAWVCQPGREPLQFRFPNVPGPRVEGAEGMVPQL